MFMWFKWIVHNWLESKFGTLVNNLSDGQLVAMSNLSVICVIACFAVLIPGKLTLSTGRFSVPATDALKLVILVFLIELSA